MKIFRASDIHRLIQQTDLIAFLTQQLAQKPEGITVPQRTLMIDPSPFSVFGTMPAKDDIAGLFMVKNAALVSSNRGAAIHAMTQVFHTRTGEPMAIMDGAAMTGYRTAGVAAAIMLHCTDEAADSLAVLGAGVQARHHLMAVFAVRRIREVSLCSRGQEKLRALKHWIEHTYPEVRVRLADSAAECVAGKSLVIAATTSQEPLFSMDGLAAEAHVSLIGGHSLESRELSHADMFRYRVITEDRAFAMAEAGHCHAACLEPHELFQLDRSVLAAQKTIFSSVGTALMDLYFVRFLLDISKNESLSQLSLTD
ncbi:ornithine cyclodeaminase family protein [Photobacterium sp. GJ3]|uniref:ornithine cyclodeaminase family protein n=1 Tax=Photobacterium sp. GJ3 TaxID=2829502 RepID=UPI001B8D8D7B|nr:ornithine cyclodeaminase family protein [Photobacterium sp. GJ3]QUJ68045.1 ornithine cyclodeaminase family protein [Photobacterium sp. GJ3]